MERSITISAKNSSMENNQRVVPCVGRTKMLDTSQKDCRTTRNLFLTGKKHKRTFPRTPVYLDLKFGTLCNLKCRSCGSVNSSSWKTDEKLIYGRVLDNKDALWVKKNPDIWDELDKIMHTVEHMDFTGGEPFMIEQHFDLLRHAVESGYAKTFLFIITQTERYDHRKKFLICGKSSSIVK